MNLSSRLPIRLKSSTRRVVFSPESRSTTRAWRSSSSSLTDLSSSKVSVAVDSTDWRTWAITTSRAGSAICSHIPGLNSSDTAATIRGNSSSRRTESSSSRDLGSRRSASSRAESTAPTLSAMSLANLSLCAGMTPCHPIGPTPTNSRGPKIMRTAAQLVTAPISAVISGTATATVSVTPSSIGGT